MNLAYQEDRIANLRALLALQWTWPGKKTLFMGCEFGQWKEWDLKAVSIGRYSNFLYIRAFASWWLTLISYIEITQLGLLAIMTGVNLSGLIAMMQMGKHYLFLRFGSYPSDTLLVACNFSGTLRHRDWECLHLW